MNCRLTFGIRQSNIILNVKKYVKPKGQIFVCIIINPPKQLRACFKKMEEMDLDAHHTKSVTQRIQ